MYGLGSLISELLSSFASPAIGAITKEATSNGLGSFASDTLDFSPDNAKLFSDIGSGTLGALAGAGLGAGLGAITGGGPGAAGGALSGGMGGGWGAYKSGDISQSLGMGHTPTMPADQSPTAGIWHDQAQQVTKVQPTFSGDGANTPTATAPASDASSPTFSPSHVDLGHYMDVAGKSMPASFTFGSGLGSMMQMNDWATEAEKKRRLQAQQDQAQLDATMHNLYNYNAPHYAAGGPIVSQANTSGVPVTVKFPEWFVDDFTRSGGLAGMLQGHADGGFLDLNLDNRNFPLAQVSTAEAEPAASPQPREVIGPNAGDQSGSIHQGDGSYGDTTQSMASGGLLRGDGDGMSDDIPANIDGQEPIRVADGEYAVPQPIAAKMEKQLQRMLTTVRSAAHPSRDKQIVKDAAKQAFIKTMSGAHA